MKLVSQAIIKALMYINNGSITMAEQQNLSRLYIRSFDLEFTDPVSQSLPQEYLLSSVCEREFQEKNMLLMPF